MKAEIIAKISIIMPVFNCAPYLEQSVGSVLKQTLTDWELICIDDGSTDKSMEILNKFAGRDPRIHLYSQSNQGAGPARNKGLEVAKGEFIAFLDADDFFLDPQALQIMYETCRRNNVDACGTNLRIFRNNQIVEDIIFNKIPSGNNCVHEYKDYQFDYGYYCFIFNRSVLAKGQIFFPDYRRFQDPVFFVQAMHTIQKFCFVDIGLYCYRAPNMAVRFDKRKLEDLLKGLRDNLQFASKYDYDFLFNQTVRRVEEEYGNIIYHNIDDTNTEVLRLLLQINDIIQWERGQEYTCLPLRKILGSVKENRLSKKEQFVNKLLQAEHILIYGAGKAALDFIEFLKKKKIVEKADAVLVTDITNNPTSVAGIRVYSIYEYSCRKNELVIITVSGLYYEEIAKLLEKKGLLDYCSLDNSIFY